MIILGINAYHGDASAAVLVDGCVVAAAEEERFSRAKHQAGFPEEAVRWCLAEAGATAIAQPSWRDAVPHRSGVVQLSRAVSLHTLSFGGPASGAPIVFLAVGCLARSALSDPNLDAD